MYAVAFREAALRVYSFLGSMRKTSQALNVSVASICRWVQRLLPKQRTSSPTKVSEALVAFVSQYVQQRPASTCAELVGEINKALCLQVSRQLVYTILVKRLGFSFKRTRKRGLSKRKQEALMQFHERFETLRNCGASFCSIDESGFDQREFPVYGYAPRGKPAIVEYSPCSTNKRISIIMCITEDGNQHHVLTSNHVDSKAFAEFVRSLKLQHGTVVLLDNASIHKTKEVRDAFQRQGLEVLHTPPYTPEYNPIENIFGILNKRFYAMRYETERVFNVQQCVEECITCLRSESVSKTFEHTFTKITKMLTNTT